MNSIRVNNEVIDKSDEIKFFTETLERAQNIIEKVITNEMPDRACVIVIRGRHGSGKTALLKELHKKYLFKMRIINYNLIYSKLKKKNKKSLKKIPKPLEFFRQLFSGLSNELDILAIDHLELCYQKQKRMAEILTTCVQKSREIRANNHHLVILITFPLSSSLEYLERSFNELKRIRESIKFIEMNPNNRNKKIEYR